MLHPAWLTEFHRRWHNARSRKASTAVRPYGVNWAELLEAAGILREEDQATATREAEALEQSGRLRLKRHRYRHYLIERIVLPLESETWFHELFDSEDSASLLSRSLSIIDRQPEHPLYQEMWISLLADLHGAFRDGSSPRPFSWRKPGQLDHLLTLIHQLTSREWESGTLIRSASVTLGYDSKLLERRQLTIASALSRFLGTPTTLADLGFILSESMLLSQGPLILHFPDGDSKDFTGLAPHSLSAADLERAVRIETPCPRLLTIENSKTTFRQFAAANAGGTTLLVASSFPTPALRALLAKLPPEIEHHHFGDSDATGFLILLKLREASPRLVHAFHMRWGRGELDKPISERDLRILGNLSDNPLMNDCQGEFNAMIFSECMGDFEQETLGPPTIDGWPFLPGDQTPHD